MEVPVSVGLNLSYHLWPRLQQIKTCNWSLLLLLYMSAAGRAGWIRFKYHSMVIESATIAS